MSIPRYYLCLGYAAIAAVAAELGWISLAVYFGLLVLLNVGDSIAKAAQS